MKTETQKHGWLKTFVLEHVNGDAESPSMEADRLLPMLRRTGKQTTRNSMIQAVRVYARQANGGNGSARRKTKGRGIAPPSSLRQIVEETTGVPVWPVVAETPPPPTPLRSGDDLIRDLGDAQVMLATLAVQVTDASVVVAKLVAEMQARRERLERFRAEL